MSTLGHTSNFAAHEPGLLLAERLLDLAGRPGKVFFCNSGAEANETGIKVARRTGRSELLAMIGSFHGRTMGALSITGQPKKYEPFTPLLPDVGFVIPNDVDHLRALVTERTSALCRSRLTRPTLPLHRLRPPRREFLLPDRWS